MLVSSLLLLGLLAYGLWEYRSHLHHLRSIPVRIHVNGTRGKSSVTRLIAAGMRAGHRRVIAKTTGTEPRVILEDGQEVPIHRVGQPNIIEQRMILRLAHERAADVLVIECMAVQPSFQRVSEERMIQSTIGVITNVRADHLDAMGPTVADVAEALASTIPRNGHLFTAEREWLPVLDRRAALRHTTVTLAKPESVPPDVLTHFRYLEHAENVALALQVCAHLGVPVERALPAMQAAAADPGALKGYQLAFQHKALLFYNGFCANDRDSTLLICRRLGLRNAPAAPVMVVLNNRGDRLQRAEQFAHMMRSDLDAHSFFLVGEATRAIEEIALREGVRPEKLVNLGDVAPQKLFEEILTRTEKRSVVLGIGNIGGKGADIMHFVQGLGEEWLKPQSAWASSSA